MGDRTCGTCRHQKRRIIDWLFCWIGRWSYCRLCNYSVQTWFEMPCYQEKTNDRKP